MNSSDLKSIQQLTRSPIAIGALIGFLIMAAVVVFFFGFMIADYFGNHYGEEDYFEDGAVLGLVGMPVVYFAYCGAAGAVIGGILGAVVQLVLTLAARVRARFVHNRQ